MVSKDLFSTRTGRIKGTPVGSTPSIVSVTDTVNTAGGRAYDTGAKHTLAQVACTGTFNGTFYADGGNILTLLEETIEKLWSEPEYIAKVAVYARGRGFMKDLPAYIVAKLADVDGSLFEKTFPRVINNGKMLRNVVQIARSGRLNKRYNLSSSMYRRVLSNWFNSRSPRALHKAAIGNDPTLADIIKMARVKPTNDEQATLYAYLIGKTVDVEKLPEPVRSYELYRSGADRSKVPNVDFRYLTDLGLKTEDWKEIARNAPWQMTRMNLNTFHRHGVLEDKAMVKEIADRLRDPQLIKDAGAFPYQLYMAYKATESNMPFEITEALQDAMEASLENAPVFQGKTYVGIDISGSMTWGYATGNRGSVTSQVRCIDIAALFGAAFLRNNRSATVMPFSNRLYPGVKFSGRDSVLTNANKLTTLPSGGTDCSLVLAELNRSGAKADAVVYVSDNESWIDQGYGARGTGMMREWVEYKKRNPKARLVLIDLQPSGNSQVTQHNDVLQVGSFSDSCFEVISTFLEHGHSADHWISEIEKTEL